MEASRSGGAVAADEEARNPMATMACSLRPSGRQHRGGPCVGGPIGALARQHRLAPSLLQARCRRAAFPSPAAGSSTGAASFPSRSRPALSSLPRRPSVLRLGVSHLILIDLHASEAALRTRLMHRVFPRFGGILRNPSEEASIPEPLNGREAEVLRCSS
ncbi:unnamed protein product [Urochloa humidicola]